MVGKLELVPLREIWKHEAYDFTTWLFENCDVLNEQLGLTINPLEMEKSVGLLIGMTGGNFASPEQFGMTPEMIHTACYRGFYATYELTEEILYLREITLREKDENYLPIGGVDPSKDDEEATYQRLSVVVPYTGKIRLARNFIEELYIHMGFQKPTAFKTVLDVTLKDGHIVEVKDRSQEIQTSEIFYKIIKIFGHILLVPNSPLGMQIQESPMLLT